MHRDIWIEWNTGERVFDKITAIHSNMVKRVAFFLCQLLLIFVSGSRYVYRDYNAVGDDLLIQDRWCER